MKLNIPIALASLFCSLSSASVTFEDLPEHVEVGQQIPLSWSSTRDYKVQELALWRVNGDSRSHVHNVEHTWATVKGNHTEIWKVPSIRKGPGRYQIWFEGVELLPERWQGNPGLNTSAHAVASSNTFEIAGGVTLFPKEIAGIVIGCVVAVALTVVGCVFVPRIIRKRRSVAVDLPGPEEGGYSDVRQGSA